jgi:hypothetical protein
VQETSELDRLLQRNQSGGFTLGTQLYEYLKAHKCIGLTAGRARVGLPALRGGGPPIVLHPCNNTRLIADELNKSHSYPHCVRVCRHQVLGGDFQHSSMGDEHGPLRRRQSGKGCAVPMASPIDLNPAALKRGSMPAEMTIHAIAFGSAFSFIAAVLAKLL